jgi:hypothetical protein
VQACSIFTDAEDERVVYVADGSVGARLSRYGGILWEVKGQVRAPDGEGHLTLVRDFGTGDLIWLHTDGVRSGRGVGWRAERLDDRLQRKLVRQDSAILAGAPWARPNSFLAAPSTLTADGRFLGVSAVSWPHDTTVSGVMILSAGDLRYLGFVPGKFDGPSIIPAPDPCCLLAQGNLVGGPDKLYRLNVRSLAIDDSFDVNPAPLLLVGPRLGQVLMVSSGAVSIYDLNLRAVVRSGSLPFHGGVVVDTTRGWIFVGEVGQLDDPGAGRVVALDTATLREVWSMVAVPGETQQMVWGIATGQGGKYLYVTSAAPPIRGLDDGELFVIDIDRRVIVSRRRLDRTGAVLSP